MNTFRYAGAIAVFAILLVIPPVSHSQTVFQASGTNTASIQATVDSFRTALGPLNANVAGSFGSGRREINWDGVPAAFSAPNLLANNFFNVNSPRGVVFSTTGTGFQVSGATTDVGTGQPAAANFGNLDPSYTANFATFSAQRLFTPIGSNIMDINFFIPGSTTPALTNGFGAVFSDVDLANTTSIQLFDSAQVLINTFFVRQTVGTATFSFLGISFPTAIISRVRITTGTAAPATGATDQNGATRDVVVMDDFIYGEPVPEPTAVMLILAGAIPLAAIARRCRGQRQN